MCVCVGTTEGYCRREKMKMKKGGADVRVVWPCRASSLITQPLGLCCSPLVAPSLV